MDKRFVLLDRDGTIVAERNYLSHPDQIELIPGAAEGLKRLSQLGFGLLVITNQSGIARGYFDEGRLAQIHGRMCDMLAEHDIRLDGIYVCPHMPEDDCGCRKPRVGLVVTAAAELGFDPTGCFMVGDKPCDIELGRRVGAGTFLVRTGYGTQHESGKTAQADYVVDDLLGVARIIAQITSSASGTDSRSD
jgi:D-glycero-D-manno-heptose 1,7-bisphosphate phosphatase